MPGWIRKAGLWTTIGMHMEGEGKGHGPVHQAMTKPKATKLHRTITWWSRVATTEGRTQPQTTLFEVASQRNLKTRYQLRSQPQCRRARLAPRSTPSVLIQTQGLWLRWISMTSTLTRATVWKHPPPSLACFCYSTLGGLTM